MTTPFAEAATRVTDGADDRAEASSLVAEMTLAEKLGCLDGDTPFWPGLMDMMAGGYYRHPWPAAKVGRLGVPGIDFADGPRGAVIADGTAFPVSMARGALFDPTIEERIGDVVGLELRAGGATFTGAVCMNLLRHPAWGRAQETYGEDPHHVGVMAAAFTRGLQRHVMACMKHFALNSMENARFQVDVTVDARALHEVYLPHFERVAGEGVASVMSAYNSVNGEWCGENRTLLTTILRDEWGWDGFVVSDFIFGLRDPAKSVRAGLDIEMPFRQQRAVSLSAALDTGELDEGDVDRCVERIVATLLRFHHVFEHAPDSSVINCSPHRALAREVASAVTVMLRNERSFLPIDASAVSEVVVLGRLAAVKNLGDGGSSDVKSTTAVTPLAGLVGAFDAAAVVHGDDLSDPELAARAASADLVAVVVGYTKHDEGEFIDNSGQADLLAELFPPTDHPVVGFPAAPPTQSQNETPAGSDAPAGSDDEPGGMSPGGDRDSLRLSDADEALIAAASQLSHNVVVVVQCGSAVMMPWTESVRAVLVSWYGGVEAGNGLADVLTGVSEPSGRLPFAIPADVDHLVPFDKDAHSASYELLHGQWLLDHDGHAAQFPFGSGRGYTTFTVDRVVWGDGDARALVTVTNTGDRTGSTVVFVHAGLEDSTVLRPVERLIGFARLFAEPGASATARIDLDWGLLDVRRDDGWWTEPGEYRIQVGQFCGDPDSIQLTTRRDGERDG
jgi:beta-glucosidase